jgi:signal transduction histidine kinase
VEAAATLERPAQRGARRWLAPAVLALGAALSIALARDSAGGASSVALLGVGLAFSLLLAVVVRLAQLASERTRALRELEAGLEARLAETSRAEAELRDAALELETFVYSVSHDLRSPLGAIVNFAAILGEDYGSALDAAGRDHLARISRSAQSAAAMMNALLAFSRAGRQELRKSWVDVEALVQSVAAELALAAGARKPLLVVDRLPPAFADPALLRLVFEILLSNALKFSRERAQPRIEVLGRADERECEYAVRDDGVGFDMRHAPKLFRVFERLHSAEEFPGDGVGLAIAARVVRRHGGRISAEAAPEKGATFRFALPRS